ncbi:hypothetical protein CEXT_264041 [Caerostris extrusa]|uniref:Uncharacterized protein n=1 Tax=Caerostris extrusa TaxID=172846 RepID=A0AAV4VNE6_CAEEX|nr:hypothetical protein CEXT_264041 [Caerostris extrusa]
MWIQPRTTMEIGQFIFPGLPHSRDKAFPSPSVKPLLNGQMLEPLHIPSDEVSKEAKQASSSIRRHKSHQSLPTAT